LRGKIVSVTARDMIARGDQSEFSARKPVFGLLVFVFGLVVGPLLHLVDHHADHTHLPDGRVDAGHAHGFAHHHDHDHEADHEDDHDDPEPPDPAHGNGSTQHFGCALLVPLAFVTPPLSNELETRSPLAPRAFHAEGRELGPIQPRAPPG